MKHSEQIYQLVAALAKASASFPPIARDCTARVTMKAGGEYSYDYADLDDVLSAVRPHLAANGLALSHDCVVVRDGPQVLAVETTARLEHASGQWRESTPLYIPVVDTMGPAQRIGSASTYGRRYTTQAILGISTERDDDGNAASGQHAQTTDKAREPLPSCPACGEHRAVIRGKSEYGGGFVCWKQKAGCGHTWGGTQQKPAENGKAAEKSEMPFDKLKRRLYELGCQSKAEAEAVVRFIVGANANGEYKWGTLEQVQADDSAPPAINLALSEALAGFPGTTILHDALSQAGLLVEPAGR